MPFTTPPTATDGLPVASAHVNALSANSSWFNGLVSTPAAAGQVPIVASASSAVYGLLSAANVHDGAVGTTQLADQTISTAQAAPGAVDSTVLASDVVARVPPLGLGAWVRLAADIAAGWARETAGDGRFFVGAGTTFSTSFTEETNYGSGWGHQHPISLGTAVGSPSSVDTNFSPAGTGTSAAVGHTHGLGWGTDVVSWVVPSRGYVAVRRA